MRLAAASMLFTQPDASPWMEVTVTQGPVGQAMGWATRAAILGFVLLAGQLELTTLVPAPVGRESTGSH